MDNCNTRIDELEQNLRDHEAGLYTKPVTGWCGETIPENEKEDSYAPASSVDEAMKRLRAAEAVAYLKEVK